MEEPTLTIDFKGLCAFVSNSADLAKLTRVDVLMMAAENVVKTHKLCRHDPVLIFREKDFEKAGDDTRHIGFQTYFPELDAKDRDQDIGVWDLRSETLSLKGAQSGEPLTFDPSYDDILGLDALTGGDATVLKSWTSGSSAQGVAARLRIDHGVLSGGPHLTNVWALAKEKDPPGLPVPFRQSVRWEIYAKPKDQFLSLHSSKNEWIQLQKGAHVMICNLCPFQQHPAGPDRDVLAYYAMAKKKVKPADRLVMHRIVPPPPPPTGFVLVKPGASACPPLTGNTV